MNNDSIYEAIAEVTNERRKLFKVLEGERTTIIALLKPFIKTELDKTIENEIKEFPEHTMTLGMEKLKDMKEELNQLISSSDELVSQTFADNSYWIHVNYVVDLDKDNYMQRYQSTRLAKDKINAGIKLLLGRAGKVLIDYGYEVPGISCTLTSKWQLNDKAQIVFGANYSLRIPTQIVDLISTYASKIEQLHDITYQLTKLTQQQQKQDAMQLWQEA